jgi:microcystin-dependent protein
MAHRPSLIGDGNVSDSEIGAIMAFPTAVEPVGFLYCDGRPVSRTTYNELFNKVGVAYGSGDGSTTFNLPDLRGQFLRGGVDFQSYTFLPANVDIGTENITITGHKFRHTGFKVRFTTTGALPTGLSAGTDYYVIYVNDNTIKVASTLANAKAGTAINITGQGTGTHTITQYADPDAASRYALQNGGASGANFGAYQDDVFESHNHTTNVGAYSSPVNDNTGGAEYDYEAASSTGFTGGSETRPQNVTVGYFIRYAAKGAIKGQDIPSGAILTFAGSSASVPNGYLLCDGSSLNRADYPELFAAIGTAWGTASGTTFNLPDTRGLFLRGVDGVANRDVDKALRTAIAVGGNTGNNVGSFQDDAFESHSHNFSILRGGNADNDESKVARGDDGTRSAYSGTTSTTGGNETRPKNVYVNHIIKY